MSNGHFHSYGGGIHPSAYIGGDPESRGWMPGAPAWVPEIDSSARIHAHVTVDAGVTGPTRIGPRAWLMSKVHIGHDVWIGPDCELAPLAVVCGYARLRSGVKMGVGALVLPYIVIGENAMIGAGAVVTKNVPAWSTYVGNPARPLDALPKSTRMTCGCWPGVVDKDCEFHGDDPRVDL